jgi:hypothetical protein
MVMLNSAKLWEQNNWERMRIRLIGKNVGINAMIERQNQAMLKEEWKSNVHML